MFHSKSYIYSVFYSVAVINLHTTCEYTYMWLLSENRKYTVGSKIIRALEIFRVKKFILNAVL